MSIDRRSVLKIIPVVAGRALAGSVPLFESIPRLHIELPPGVACRPLDEIKLHGAEHGTIVVEDGTGNVYVHEAARDPFSFKVAGALGMHTASLRDAHGAVIAFLPFEVDCRTEIHDEGGIFQELLTDVLWTIMDWNQEAPVNVIRYKDRVYQMFANWIFDHTLILKAMKFYWPDLKDAVDFFAETQREDGMIWENCYPATPEPNYFDWKFSYGEFVRRLEDGFRQLRRAPVESHVEQFYLEALYYTWKATGDDEWMRAKLDGAIRAVRYATSDPYRWSKKHQLMHRGFTIDTWDYTSDDQQKIGSDCVFIVYLDKSEFGVFFGDNTNLIAGCRRLAEMLEYVGRRQEAQEFESLATTLESRLDQLAWNGEFYTHWIAEDPDYKPDVGVDMAKQVSLSNAYSLNRGISHDKCVAILRTYQRIRREIPEGSPGEFYGIYPPFQRGFTQNMPGKVWEYVNGGVLACVAGELAHGALEHGFEEYGVDILRRQRAVAKRYRGYLPATLRGRPVEAPQRSFQKLDLRSVANVDLGAGAAGVPGWIGEDGLDLRDLPTGTQEFQGVPFDVIVHGSNRNRTCLGLSRSAEYQQQAYVPVHSKASSIYLLHAAAGHDKTVGTFTIRYADGTSYSEYVEVGRNVGSWWEPQDSKYGREGPRNADRLRVVWQKASNGLPSTGIYAAGFDNPYPDREISSLDLMAGAGNTKWMILAATVSNSPVFFAPYDDLSSGIPDGWSAALAYALIEGLAGVKDKGTVFSRTLIAPRWEAAGVHSAEVTVKYEASGAYCHYRYSRNPDKNRIAVEFTGTGKEFELQILLPKGSQFETANLDGQTADPVITSVEQSKYVLIKVPRGGVHRLELDLLKTVAPVRKKQR